jgi:hypothetical protein
MCRRCELADRPRRWDFDWRRDWEEGKFYYLVYRLEARGPGQPPRASRQGAFLDRDSAEALRAERDRQEAVARPSPFNPYLALAEHTTWVPALLRDLVLDLGLEPPDNFHDALAWDEWWGRAALDGWQRAEVRRALDLTGAHHVVLASRQVDGVGAALLAEDRA